jgi:hypothetical protein
MLVFICGLLVGPQNRNLLQTINDSMSKSQEEVIIRCINELNHKTLAHRVFQRCFAEAVKSGEIRGLKKSSLFRSTLAYFLFVSNAREKFVRELQIVVSGKTLPIDADDA